jgi:hypothetical protein
MDQWLVAVNFWVPQNEWTLLTCNATVSRKTLLRGVTSLYMVGYEAENPCIYYIFNHKKKRALRNSFHLQKNTFYFFSIKVFVLGGSVGSVFNSLHPSL